MDHDPNPVESFGYHTFRQTLATPAYRDWRHRLRELYEAGDRVGCLVHWSRGLEVQHARLSSGLLVSDSPLVLCTPTMAPG